MNREGWFHTKSLVVTHLKLLVLTLLNEETLDLSQRPNLPGSSRERWHLARAGREASEQRSSCWARPSAMYSSAPVKVSLGTASFPALWAEDTATLTFFSLSVSPECERALRASNRTEFLFSSSSLGVWACLGLCWNIYIK